MNRLQRHLCASLLTALCGLAALSPARAQTYRIVGPDGKITYSDRKPTDPQVRTRALGQTVTSPLFPPTSTPFDLRPAATVPPAARPVAGDAPPVDISGQPFPPNLPEALLDVMVHQFFVQTLVETCDRARPAFAERYRGGVLNWRTRNADILDRSNHIAFTRFTGEQRDLLRATGRARLAPLLPAADATPEDKMLWCDRMSTDLARHQFELVGDRRVEPILDFQAP